MSSFWLTLKQQWTIKISSPLFSIFSLAAILVGSRDHRANFWKGAIQGPFHQSLVAIGPVVSEEKIKMWNVDGRTTDDGWRTKSDDNSSPGLKERPDELKSGMYWIYFLKSNAVSFRCFVDNFDVLSTKEQLVDESLGQAFLGALEPSSNFFLPPQHGD